MVEKPKPSLLPYFATAILAALAVWTIQQRSVDDLGPGGTQRGPRTANGAQNAKGDVRTLFSADDYPAEAIRNGDEGTVQAQLAVDAKGRVTGCSIIRSSGHATLDRVTCRILQRRARFNPARDVDGKAVADEVTTPPIVWRLEG